MVNVSHLVYVASPHHFSHHISGAQDTKDTDSEFSKLPRPLQHIRTVCGFVAADEPCSMEITRPLILMISKQEEAVICQLVKLYSCSQGWKRESAEKKRKQE